jgi:O-antigen ligase
MSSSRGSIIGISFGFLVAVILLFRVAGPWAKHFAMCFMLGLCFWFFLSFIIPYFLIDSINVSSIKTHTSGRLPLFIEAFAMSMENFPVGMGPQSWLTHSPITESYSSSQKFGHPHNMYLMWAAEYGWLTIFLLMLVAFQAISLFFRTRVKLKAEQNIFQAVLLAGFTASLSGALIHAGVSAVFLAPGSMLVGLFVIIGFWALVINSDSSSDCVRFRYSSERLIWIRVLGIFLFILFYILWVYEVKSYYTAMKIDKDYYVENHIDGIFPRFWHHGNFPRR